MLRVIFILSILIPGFAAAIFNRFAAVLLYIWFALFRPQDWLWTDITHLRLSLVIGVLALIPRGRSAPDTEHGLAEPALPNLTHPLSLGALVFLGAAFLGQTNAPNQALGWQWLEHLFRLVLITLVLVSVASTPKRFAIAVGVIGASLGFHSAKAGIAALLSGGGQIYQGLGGAFSDNNDFALAIVMILAYLAAAAQIARARWLRLAFSAAVPLSAFAIICTFSRGGFMALGMATLTFLLLQRRRMLGIALVGAAAVAGLLTVGLPSGYTERLQTITTYRDVGEDSALSRLHFWRVAVDMAQQNPFGVGLHNYAAAYNRYDFTGGRYGRGRTVHSSYFQVLAETGYLGMAAFIGLFVYAFVVAFRVRSRSQVRTLKPDEQTFLLTMANAVTTSMVGFLVGGAFLSQALNDLTWLTFGLVAALDRLSARMVEVRVAAQPAVTLASQPAYTVGPWRTVAPGPSVSTRAGWAPQRIPSRRTGQVR